MKALRLHGPGDLRLADEPAPTPGPGEVLVRVTAVGICGSDLHWYDESAIGDAVLTRPLVLGHEAAGVIVDGPRAGQRVALDPQISDQDAQDAAAAAQTAIVRDERDHHREGHKTKKNAEQPAHILLSAAEKIKHGRNNS